MSHEFYENPLITRYASRTMATLWSAQRKHSTWRKLWVALAEAERDPGIGDFRLANCGDESKR